MKTTSFFTGILLVICLYEMPEASSSIADRDFLNTFDLPNCDDFKRRLLCAQIPYRTFDGTCNNLCNTDRGAIFRPHRRLESLAKPTAYEGDNFGPRQSSAIPDKLLPNARKVSTTVFISNSTANINNTAPNFTHITMTWGQFIDHDITLTELEAAECGNNINVCPQRPGCIGIDILRGNELGANASFKCIPLRRSFRDSQGNHINIITSYMDGSQVYGSNIELANRLRGKHGLLDVRPFKVDFGRDVVLPPDDETFCRSENREEAPCFLAGDPRSNENHALTTMHVVWVREHNRIATALGSLNPHWSSEKVFQVARKIVGAEIQHITYNEWLPVLFDEKVDWVARKWDSEEFYARSYDGFTQNSFRAPKRQVEIRETGSQEMAEQVRTNVQADTKRAREGLLLEQDGQFYSQYDPRENPEMVDGFSTAALRMGHTLIADVFVLRDSILRTRGFGVGQPSVIPTKDFYDPAPFFLRGNNAFGGVAIGLVFQLAQQVDIIFAPAVREFLNFEGPGDGTFGDLTAINIQRGRDHGLPGYTKYLEALLGRSVKTFGDISDLISKEQIVRLKSVYTNVFDIDFFVGGISENPDKGSVLGPTFTKLITKQFRESRQGDRFWYERKHELGFTPLQLTEIRKVSLSRVLCDNVHLMQFISRYVFRPARRASNCGSLPSMDLRAFSEEFAEPEGAEAESNAPVGA